MTLLKKIKIVNATLFFCYVCTQSNQTQCLIKNDTHVGAHFFSWWELEL